jgi:hypothetical protein|tara:strand:- start:7033 stop:7239 length:207 start_codon:yes stop_codon:yes gene_type:complete
MSWDDVSVKQCTQGKVPYPFPEAAHGSTHEASLAAGRFGRFETNPERTRSNFKRAITDTFRLAGIFDE